MIDALATRYGLAEPAIGQLRTLLEVVATGPDAPTTVTAPGAIARDHLADSLVALELPEVRAATSVADLGSGAGFPGLPLAIALPAARVTLVESNGRKCEFIARAATACGLDNAETIHARAEEWTAGVGRCDLVVIRAVAPLAVVAEYAAPLLRIGGTLVAWRGRRDLDDEAQGARAAADLGLAPPDVLRVWPFPDARDRHLHRMIKVAPTPSRFPRRPGMARKRPLGASGEPRPGRAGDASRAPSDRERR